MQALRFLATALMLAMPLAHAAQPINVAAEHLTQTAELKNWRVNLAPPMKIGSVSKGLFCNGSTEMTYNKAYDQFLMRRAVVVFQERATALGYPQHTSEQSAFDQPGASNSADFRIGLTLMALNNNVCIATPEMSGTSTISLRVELFSNKLQKVVYSRTVEGSFSSDSKIKETQFHDKLLANALEQMFADPAYVNVLRNSAAVAAPAAAALEAIAVKNGARPKEPVKTNSRPLLSSVVVVENSGTSGSGFFVGRDGYVISNQHVVGDAKFVRVRLQGGFSVPGEVVRRDPARDVALIKTDIEPPVPPYVRLTIAKVGDEVYAIGSPLGAALNNSVTRGVFSGVRKFDEQTYIQSDVSVNPGSSGGPLVDADGAVIGLTVIKVGTGGINLFIPVGEALEKLGLNLQ